jgi:hypothetical protein
MHLRIRKFLYFLLPLSFIVLMVSTYSVSAQGSSQQPTVPIATVTSTPTGPIVTVRSDGEAYINVRSGPSIFYEKIGVLLQGQQIPAKGRSAGGDWILIDYPGVPGGMAWVYAPMVNLTPGQLPIVEPPPLPTPLYTATIDPTLAAQFIVTSMPTRLPTFTEPAPLNIPTYTAEPQSSLSGIPLGLIIIVLIGLGIFIGLFSITRSS